MSLKLNQLSAYSGRGWRPRTGRLSDEMRVGGIWAPMRVNSEYKRLEAVLLYCPGGEMTGIKDPNEVQHIAKISPALLAGEYREIISVFRKLGVTVQLIEPRGFWKNKRPDKYNLMYVRDLFFATPEGAVLARMASRVRAGEEKYAARALSDMGVPINRTISGTGLFEGADALWLDRGTVLCGTGNRTNREGFAQLRETLKAQDVRTEAVELPRGVQHLLGLLQIVDSGLALVRTGLASLELLKILKKKRISVVPVPETEEVLNRQGMNIVTVSPGRIIMPEGCPELRKLYRAAGVAVAAEVPIRQVIKGAGGLACATGILSRSLS